MGLVASKGLCFAFHQHSHGNSRAMRSTNRTSLAAADPRDEWCWEPAQLLNIELDKSCVSPAAFRVATPISRREC